jgi:Tol biopolymer transport system component
MKKAELHLVIVLILCVLVLVLPATAAVNGKIAFVSSRDGNNEIYTVNPDGTSQTRLTNNAASDTAPAWSPDGKKIAFTSDRDGNNEICVMNADGTSQKCITMSSASDSEPTWSPDGKKIAFTSNRDGNNEIYIMNLDGTSQTRITMNAGSDSNPAWSPDGKKIAFVSVGEGNKYGDVYMMNADGTEQTRLTKDPRWYSSPKWSPDGTKIAVDGTDIASLIFVMNTDGTGETCLTPLGPNNLDPFTGPDWSPDGKKIAYTSGYENFYVDNMGWVNTEIYVMNADGTGKTRISNTSVKNHQVLSNTPTWSSDGKKIAFSSELDGDKKIYVMNAADGSNPIPLASGASPLWRPEKTSITVTSPYGGESWPRGTSHSVTWEYVGDLGSTVKIVLLKAGTEVGTIVASTPIGTGGKGSYSWPILSTGSTGSDYKVSVQSISQPTIKDISNNNFTINPAGTTAPTITVTSPNSGELWYKYTWHNITWSYTGSPGSTVKIALLKGGTPVGTIADNIPIGSGGKGTYKWFVWTNLTSGSDYKVSVQSKSQPVINDLSNVNFKIYWP